MNRTSAAGRSRAGWYWAFLVPLALVVGVPLYNRVEPRLWGIPFFYWSQLLFVIVGALVTGLVYCLTPNCGSTMPQDGETP
ncbi:DUF3311 domain-containing protein [Paraburkholderia lycopersici]|uniref:Uncharacterized protein n=1 Tax=Paraburkholderia lycopersici TaxID=416944 RepID=A0A1G6X7Z7_9BURK|nr:DUF3311 domain-containing protein [Paraburkholderia lycopersici]SDD74248.1 Protein of unknown function [Paraburkholderia lycopersici]